MLLSNFVRSIPSLHMTTSSVFLIMPVIGISNPRISHRPYCIPYYHREIQYETVGCFISRKKC